MGAASTNQPTAADAHQPKQRENRSVIPTPTVVHRAQRFDTNNRYRGSVAKNTSFSLDEHFNAFIEEEAASGCYRSAGDVVRSTLRLLEDRETRLHALRQAVITGERSGESTALNFDEFVTRKRAEESHRR